MDDKAIEIIKAKHEIVECLFGHLDRMNDTCELDTAEEVLNDFTSAVMPKIEALLQVELKCLVGRQEGK